MKYIILECDRYQEKPTTRFAVYTTDNPLDKWEATKLLQEALLADDISTDEFEESFINICVGEGNDTFTFFGEEIDYIIVSV